MAVSATIVGGKIVLTEVVENGNRKVTNETTLTELEAKTQILQLDKRKIDAVAKHTDEVAKIDAVKSAIEGALSTL